MAIAEGIKQPEIAKKFRSAAPSCRTSPRAACIRTCRGPTASRRRPSGPAASTRDFPTTTRPTSGSWSWKRRSSTSRKSATASGRRSRPARRSPACSRPSSAKWSSGSSRLRRCRPPWTSAARPRSPSTVVMHLSDGHHDQVVRPEEVGGLEDYNFPISCARAERYVDTVVEWTPGHPGAEVLLSGALGAGLRRLHQRRNPQSLRAVLLPQPVQELPGHRPASRPDVPRPGGPLRAGPCPVPGGQPRPADAEEGLPRRQRQLGLPGCRGGPACTAASWATSTSPSPMRGVPTSTSTASASTSSHGDDVRSNLGIPWYGMVRRQKGLIALGAAAGAQRCRYFCVRPSPRRQHPVRRGRRTAGQRVVGRHRRLRLQLALRLPRARPVDSRRQPEARHHLAHERQAAPRAGEATARGAT